MISGINKFEQILYPLSVQGIKNESSFLSIALIWFDLREIINNYKYNNQEKFIILLNHICLGIKL